MGRAAGELDCQSRRETSPNAKAVFRSDRQVFVDVIGGIDREDVAALRRSRIWSLTLTCCGPGRS